MEGINYLAVLAAAASAFLLGGLWYSPIAFLKPWTKAFGMGDMKEVGAKHPAQVFGVSFLFALLAAASFGINYQFANKPFALWLIDGGYHVGQFLIYGLILGLWH